MFNCRLSKQGASDRPARSKLCQCQPTNATGGEWKSAAALKTRVEPGACLPCMCIYSTIRNIVTRTKPPHEPPLMIGCRINRRCAILYRVGIFFLSNGHQHQPQTRIFCFSCHRSFLHFAHHAAEKKADVHEKSGDQCGAGVVHFDSALVRERAGICTRFA